jgi:phosphoglucosamine mutase
MRRYFGTDGVRGVYGEDLTVELVERLGRAFATWSGSRPVLVGRDTRASGPPLEEALARGLAACGSDVLLGGVLPTPAVALLAGDSGAVVSASHNPAEYNGIKFFAEGGKLTDEDEERIEAFLDAADGDRPGRVERLDGCAERYVDVLCERFGAPLRGLRVVLDCANGAMSSVAPETFSRLGADVIPVANEPDGSNINRGCGATDLSLLAGLVPEQHADLGIAFDGDGDRVLAIDGEGNVVDGDQIVAILALHHRVDLVAVTVMTNLGFHRLMEEHGIRVVTTDVGDRYVLEALRREDGVLGGEESGHVLWLDGHVNGDGLAAALLLCRALVEQETTLSEAAAVMARLPQAKANVRVRTKTLTPAVLDLVKELNEQLSGSGRVLVRPSGTEPVVRVLAEAEIAPAAVEICSRMREVVERELG